MFEKPTLELVKFDVTDILTASPEPTETCRRDTGFEEDDED